MGNIEFDGKLYTSVMEFYKAEYRGEASYQTFRARILSGWPLEKVLATPLVTPKDKYIVENVVYESLKKLAGAAGISYMSAVKRAHRGFTDHEIFYGKPKKQKIPKEVPEKAMRGNAVIAGGETYENINSARVGTKSTVSLNTVRRRLDYGFSVDEALGLVQRQDQRSARHSSVSLTINGYSMNLSKASAEYKISESTIRDRLARGATAEQAVGLMPIKQGELISQRKAYKGRVKRIKEPIYFNGQEYKSIKILAESFDLPRYLVYNRIKVYGWSLDRAVSEPATDTVEIGGRQFKSALNAWETLGQTSLAQFGARRKAGYQIAICLGIEPLPARDRYELNGKYYSSLDEVAKEYNVTASQIGVRLKTMSLEEAVLYQPVLGRYTKAKLQADVELASRPAILYFVRIDTGEGVLQKIGITTRSIKARLGISGVESICEWQGTLMEMYAAEQRILKFFSDNHYRAEQGFDGKTETFIFLPSEELEVIEYANSIMDDSDF